MPVKFQVNLFQRREADFSDCRQYRYSLRIVWSEELPVAAFIGLNPSTADEIVDDNTVRRCRGYSERWGCGGMLMLNLFAYRATDPRVMKAHPSPIGARNLAPDLARLLDTCQGPRIACWGTHGSYMERGEFVAARVGPLLCLGRNADGTPKHPLYLRGDAQPEPFNFS